MKRAGHLWERIIAWDNLVLAFHRAARGKRHKVEVRRFAEELEGSLRTLRSELLEDSLVVGRFNTFKVYDPKERTIHAARFPERVFHHALMNVCEPVFERHLVYHTYACRKDKGRPKAIAAGEKRARANSWYLKLDIRKYFESIPHDILISRLHRLFKDPKVLAWFERIIRSHNPDTGRGLPIGSLTSQHLANFYLSQLDRLCQALPGVNGYVRYMDDFVCWARDKAALLDADRHIEAFVSGQLGLRLKHPPAPQRSDLGMDFLGFRIFPTHTRLNRRSKVRYRRKTAKLASLHGKGVLSESETQQRLTALTAFTLPARSWHYRTSTLTSFRSAAIGHEPGEPGRQLEQQRDQLPCFEPQQQQPGQQQPQHWLPPCPQLGPTTPDGGIRHHQGTEPAAAPIPHMWDKANPTPVRAGRPEDTSSNTRFCSGVACADKARAGDPFL